MSQSPISAFRIFFGFLWRGALIGIAGGIAVPVLTVQLIMALVLLNPFADVPFLIRICAPAGTLLGILAAYISIKLDRTESFWARARFLGYVGFSVGGFYGSLGALAVLFLGGVVVTGPIAGLAAGIVVAVPSAWFVRRNFRPLLNPAAYDRIMRRYMAAVGFAVGAVTWMAVLRGLYRIWPSEDLNFVVAWIALGLFAGFVSAAFAHCKSSCLTGWYSRASQGLPSPFAIIWRDFRPPATASG